MAATAHAPERLQRSLGPLGAALLGLGSMLGTGVFFSVALGAALAGPAVSLALLISAAVALCNGLSSAQLAAAYPVSGGTYEYACRLLNAPLGFAAGWLFVAAKTASAAAAALAFSAYTLALFGVTGWLAQTSVALAAVLLLGFLAAAGLRQSSAVNTVLVAFTLFALGFFVMGGLPTALMNGAANLLPFFAVPATGLSAAGGPASLLLAGALSPQASALLTAAALLFVAFSGYGRIATLGEEIIAPRTNIPLAILAALGAATAVYAAVALVAVAASGQDGLAAAVLESRAPLSDVARRFALPGAPLLLTLGAAAAMLSVLLNLMLGISRVLLALARRGDLPAGLARLEGGGRTPRRAALLALPAIALAVLPGSILHNWAFSALTILLYYAITNLAALRLPHAQRLYPAPVAVAGLAACLLLSLWIDARTWLWGAGVLLFGFILRAILRRSRSMPEPA